MQKTKKIYAGGYYIFSGCASANSCFIENLKEANLFIRLANQYLKDYVKIHEYLLTPDGWMIQLTIGKKKKILKAFYRQKQLKGINSDDLSTEIWRIISERVRLMLSQFVIRTNKMEGREGSKVKESYHRYYFDNASEAREFIKNMRNQNICLYQRNKKYRKIKSHYTIPKKEGKGSVFLCSKRLKKRKSGVDLGKKIGLKCFKNGTLRQVVVANLVNSTLYLHNPTRINKNSS